jgi:Alkaline phosphatase PhoX
MRRILLIALALAATMAVTGIAVGKPKNQPTGFTTAIKPYAVGLNGWDTHAIISSNDVVSETGSASGQYRMVGIPDGLGVVRKGKGARVFMNHELVQTDQSEPRVGQAKQRGAFVSEWRLNKKAEVISGRRAFDTVYQDNTLVGPAADTSNTTPAFSRFCSAFLATRRVGFDRPIFMTNEETGPASSGPTATFDPKGSQSVAIFNQQAHALSKLGHFPKENTLVMRGTGNRTIILSTEDGPRTPDSQLYLYIGRKHRESDNVLSRNGLDNGKLYAFAADDASTTNENQLLQGDTVHGTFKEIPNADTLTDVQTEAAADAVGAFGFVRIEDGEFKPNAKRTFWFDTTGDQASTDETNPHINELGRLYSLKFDGRDPLKGATLTQRYNADQLTAQQDGPLSPDNVTVTKRFIAVNEDGTGGGSPGGTGSRDDMNARNRDGSIWIVPLATAGDPSTFTRAGELVGRSEGGRDDIKTTSGIWETSGIVGSRHAFGRNTFLFDVQAHSPTTAPGGTTVTVEDGQLLLLHK